MSNGLGAGFAALTLLAVLAGLSLLVVLGSVAAYGFRRRTGRSPTGLRYLLVVLGVGVLGVAGFGVLALSDEAPPLAGLFAAVALVPLLAVSGYLARTTASAGVESFLAAVVAWGPLLLPGVVVVFGVTNGLEAAFGLTSGESRQLGLAWVGAAVGGLAIVLGMLLLGPRLDGVVRAVSGDRDGD